MPLSDQSKYDRSKYEKMTLFQLLCKYWELCEYNEDMLHGYDPCYRWVVVNKSWVMEFLGEKWPKRFPSFISVILKMDELEQEFDPTICTDSEYFENLVKRKKSIQRKKRKHYRHYLKIMCGRWQRPLRF